MARGDDRMAEMMDQLTRHDMDDQYLVAAKRVLLSSKAHVLHAKHFSPVELPPIMTSTIQPLVAECLQFSTTSLREMLKIDPMDVSVRRDIDVSLDILPPQLQQFFIGDSKEIFDPKKIYVVTFDHPSSYSFEYHINTSDRNIIRYIQLNFLRIGNSNEFHSINIMEKDTVRHLASPGGVNLVDLAQRNVDISLLNFTGNPPIAIVTGSDRRWLERVLGKTSDGKYPIQRMEIEYKYSDSACELKKAEHTYGFHLLRRSAADIFKGLIPKTDSGITMFSPPDLELTKMCK